MTSFREFFHALSKEPPFRIISRAVVKRLSGSLRTKSMWDTPPRPHYMAGVLAGADQAKAEGVTAISVYEFGVAGGNGLLALADCATKVQEETGVAIKVYGFDMGSGLPQLCGDYRDYPDHWRPGDYPMDEPALRARLGPNTTLVIGDTADTVAQWIPTISEPIGFVAVDVDLYSSTRSVLKMFTIAGRRMLRHVPMYFDDVDFFFMHRFAGELFAIDEFNRSQETVKIDHWRGIEKHRPFADAFWLKKMYVAHDLRAISDSRVSRPSATISVDTSAYGT